MSEDLWSWLRTRLDELRTLDADAVADVLGAGLREIDEHLEVEIHDGDGAREIVISAGRRPELFALVRELVASAPSLPRWRFVALRPRRGFEFEFHAGGRRIDARALAFVPQKSDAGLSVRLLVPNPEFEGWPDVAWQIIEAGIGEEAAARLTAVEIGTRESDTDHVLAIESLRGYVERHTKPVGA